MRYIQTFWTSDKNPLAYNFGWDTPYYNLLSWAYSCYCLRKLSDEVELYTDIKGKEILIDLLHLPYTKVHVIYDKDSCNSLTWALIKIKTYSIQTEPFVHIDGDVYLYKDIEPHSLILQNKEIGKCYYKNEIPTILENNKCVLPEYIRTLYKNNKLNSYCFGIFGGTDLDYINKYCNNAKKFVEENKFYIMNNSISCCSFFEQVIFAAMVEKDNRDVYCLGRTLISEWYSRLEFCDFNKNNNKIFNHLLFTHKNNKINLRKLLYKVIKHCPNTIKILSKLYPELKEKVSCIINYQLFNETKNKKLLHYINTKTLKPVSYFENIDSAILLGKIKIIDYEQNNNTT